MHDYKNTDVIILSWYRDKKQSRLIIEDLFVDWFDSNITSLFTALKKPKASGGKF